MRVPVTGATGYLGWRAATLLTARGHDVLDARPPGPRGRAHAADLDDGVVDAGDPAARALVAGRDAVLHFAGVPDPAARREDPATAVRENAGTTRQPARGLRRHGAALVFPSTARAGPSRRPIPTASPSASARRPAGCTAPRAVVAAADVGLRPRPGRLGGRDGAIAAFAARALDGRPISIPGDPRAPRDFLYVDDLVAGSSDSSLQGALGRRSRSAAAARHAAAGRRARWRATPPAPPSRSSRRAASCPPGEGSSYARGPATARLGLTLRPLDDAVTSYVDWLRRHPAAQGRS